MDFSEIGALLRIKEVVDSPIEDNGLLLGWHSVITTVDGIIGGGVNVDKNIARRVAVAEVLERLFFRKIYDSVNRNDFLIDKFPTTCGFAAGFEQHKTRLRSLSEAIERWAWSKWIDDGYNLKEIILPHSQLTEIAKFLFHKFDKVVFLHNKINTHSIPQYPDYIEFGVVIGIKDKGVFPGSRIASHQEDLWEHSLVEAYRHFLIFKQKENELNLQFPYNRIIHFGNKADEAFYQVQKAALVQWPEPQILLDKSFNTGMAGVTLHRSILTDYVGWDRGNVDRFVY